MYLQKIFKRNGGYVRIIKSGFRYGDSAPKAIIELVERDVDPKVELIKINLKSKSNQKNKKHHANHRTKKLEPIKPESLKRK